MWVVRTELHWNHGISLVFFSCTYHITDSLVCGIITEAQHIFKWTFRHGCIASEQPIEKFTSTRLNYTITTLFFRKEIGSWLYLVSLFKSFYYGNWKNYKKRWDNKIMNPMYLPSSFSNYQHSVILVLLHFSLPSPFFEYFKINSHCHTISPPKTSEFIWQIRFFLKKL